MRLGCCVCLGRELRISRLMSGGMNMTCRLGRVGLRVSGIGSEAVFLEALDSTIVLSLVRQATRLPAANSAADAG